MSKKKKRNKPIISINENTTKKIVTTRPRVSAISKLYNVSDERIINFLDSLGFENIGPNSLLTKEMLICTKAEFASDKNLKDQIRGKTEIQFVNPLNKINDKQETSIPLTSYIPSIDPNRPKFKKKKKQWNK